MSVYAVRIGVQIENTSYGKSPSEEGGCSPCGVGAPSPDTKLLGKIGRFRCYLFEYHVGPLFYDI